MQMELEQLGARLVREGRRDGRVASLNNAVLSFTLGAVTEALLIHDGNITHAATSLGLQRTTLVERLKKWDMLKIAYDLRRDARSFHRKRYGLDVVRKRHEIIVAKRIDW